MTSNETAAATFASESVWLDANRYYDAERTYEVSTSENCRKANPCGNHSAIHPVPNGISNSSLASEIAYAREKIQNFLKSGEAGKDLGQSTVVNRLEVIEQTHAAMAAQIAKLTSEVAAMTTQLASMNKLIVALDTHVFNGQLLEDEKREDSNMNGDVQNGASETADDDDLDLFGSDEEDASATKLREERLQAYAEKKSKKPALVAKSSVVLDVKPWSDETDMKEMEKVVRAVQCDGLVWGASKFVPLAYGISKLQIVAIVEDAKVSIDWLTETISDNDELVQSVDIAAFNKL